MAKSTSGSILEIAVVDVVASMPWVGPDGVEGVLVTRKDGEYLLLKGLEWGSAPNSNSRAVQDGSSIACAVPGCGYATAPGLKRPRQALSYHMRSSHS